MSRPDPEEDDRLLKEFTGGPPPDASAIEKLTWWSETLQRYGDVVICQIKRGEPKHHNGHDCHGHLESREWIWDPGDFLKYLENTWGGRALHLQPQLDRVKGRGKVFVNWIRIEIDAPPRRHGVIIGEEKSAPDQTQQVVAATERAAAAEAKATVEASKTQVGLLREQLDRAERRAERFEDLMRSRSQEPRGVLSDAEALKIIKGDGGASMSAQIEGVRTALTAQFATERAGLTERINRLQDQVHALEKEHGEKIHGIEREHRAELERVKSESAAALEKATQRAEDRFDKELTRLREDKVQELAKASGNADERLKLVEKELERTRVECADLRKEAAALREKAYDVREQVKTISALRDAVGSLGGGGDSEDKTMFDQIMGHSDEIAQVLTALRGGSAPPPNYGVAPPAIGPAPRPWRSRPKPSPAAPSAPADNIPGPNPTPTATNLPPDASHLVTSILKMLETALAEGTSPGDSARAIASSVDHGLLRQVVEAGPFVVLPAVLEHAGEDHVLASARGKRYIRAVLVALPQLLPEPSVQPDGS